MNDNSTLKGKVVKNIMEESVEMIERLNSLIDDDIDIPIKQYRALTMNIQQVIDRYIYLYGAQKMKEELT